MKHYSVVHDTIHQRRTNNIRSIDGLKPSPLTQLICLINRDISIHEPNSLSGQDKTKSLLSCTVLQKHFAVSYGLLHIVMEYLTNDAQNQDIKFGVLVVG